MHFSENETKQTITSTQTKTISKTLYFIWAWGLGTTLKVHFASEIHFFLISLEMLNMFIYCLSNG
jgi:hypothetical protein